MVKKFLRFLKAYDFFEIIDNITRKAEGRFSSAFLCCVKSLQFLTFAFIKMTYKK